MAYDSKTYGQSPFGNPQKPNSDDASEAALEEGLDFAPTKGAADKFPAISTIPGAQPADLLADQFDVDKNTDKAASTTRRKSRASSKPSTTKTPRKAKKTRASNKTAKAPKAEPETAEEAIARRFLEEDRNAYLSLLYKTAISGLVWAVLRLVRHQVSDRAIAIINIIIHPVLVSTLSLIGTIGLTFWLRRLLKDLAIHTQQLTVDAEAPEGKNYRPTLEIVGDSLEYNPKLRKQLSHLFNAASILICTLISYVMTSLLLPWG
ncbi:MAG: hypothetical protein WA949_01380 [Phormidesmis sp.]